MLDPNVVASIVGVGGTLFGVGVTILVQFILQKRQTKNEKDASILSLKISTYSKAVEYSLLRAKIHEIEKLVFDDSATVSSYEGELHKLLIKENNLYCEFFATFAMIAPKQLFDDYHKFLDEIENGKISSKEARMKAISLLDFNIYK